MKFKYRVDEVEHDSWSGPELLNSYFYDTQQEAKDAIVEYYKGRDRSGPVPEYYVNLEYYGKVPVPE